MNSAIRRHHYQRRKKKAKHYWFANYAWSSIGENDDKTCAKIANTPHPCSCYGCGNPRKHFKEPTRQERMKTLEFELEAE